MNSSPIPILICIFKQKLLKNKISYLILIFIIPLLFTQCINDEKEVNFDYQGRLKYFSNQNGIEHFIESENKTKASLPLPECFSTDYSDISLTNENNFVCSENKVHFSIDEIPKSEVNYYAEYFNDLEIKEQEDINIMRDYCVETRAFGLIDSKKSIYSILTTKENKVMLLGSVKGKTDTTSKELFYQFGVIEGKESYFVLQAIVSSENVSFLHLDILEIFKNFKIK